MKSKIFSALNIILFISVLSMQRADAQEIPAGISQIVPQAAEKLNSGNTIERISVLDEVVEVKDHQCYVELTALSKLQAPDFSYIIAKIFEKDLTEIDKETASRTLWKIEFLMQKYLLKEFSKNLVAYIPKFPVSDQQDFKNIGIQFGILETLKKLEAKEYAPEIAVLLQPSIRGLHQEALMTLVELGAKEAIPALTTLLYDNNPYQRTYALQSLVKVNGKSAASEIVRLFDDENANNRYWALDALIKLDARAYSGKFRQLIGSNQTAQTESYAIAGLVYFGDAKAIEIAGQKLSENKEEDRYLLEQLVELKARKIVPTLISILEKADYSRENAYKFPTAIIYALGKFEAREAAPVLRTVIEKNSLAGKIPAIQVLGNFEDKDAVDDLLNVFYKSLPEPPDRITNATYDSAEAALALAKIGDKKVWKDLIDAAANPKYPYRSQIIVELNKHLDKELWQKTMTKQVSSQRFVSIKEIADDFSRKTEIPVVLHFEVGKDAAKRRPIANEVIDTNGYPWTSISEGTSLLDGLREIPKSISDGTLPQNFTFIFDKNQIHILTVEKAVKWWRENILRTENKDART